MVNSTLGRFVVLSYREFEVWSWGDSRRCQFQNLDWFVVWSYESSRCGFGKMRGVSTFNFREVRDVVMGRFDARSISTLNRFVVWS